LARFGLPVIVGRFVMLKGAIQIKIGTSRFGLAPKVETYYFAY